MVAAAGVRRRRPFHREKTWKKRYLRATRTAVKNLIKIAQFLMGLFGRSG
jgi:hypothetical protein